MDVTLSAPPEVDGDGRDNRARAFTGVWVPVAVPEVPVGESTSGILPPDCVPAVGENDPCANYP